MVTAQQAPPVARRGDDVRPAERAVDLHLAAAALRMLRDLQAWHDDDEGAARSGFRVELV